MSRREISLAAAQAAAKAQRVRLAQRLDATMARLAPARLRWDAQQEVERRIQQGARVAVDQVKSHPLAAGAGLLVALAWMFRDQLLEHGPPALRSAYDRILSHPAFSAQQAESGEEFDTPTEQNLPQASAPPAEASDERE
jgi:hypothetical protein